LLCLPFTLLLKLKPLNTSQSVPFEISLKIRL
jgi:hypothetical protein